MTTHYPMRSIVNFHVIDPKNVGDLISSPTQYFDFPGYTTEQLDIRHLDPEYVRGKHIIVGGGGLLYTPFLNNISKLVKAEERGKLIAWGIGQQIYHELNPEKFKAFDYPLYLNGFDLTGIRDFECGYDWVPCASCMHPAFDQSREIKHDFVVFSHKKFQLKIDGFPRMTNEVNDLEKVLDFLGSGETILTSSYHGAYWGTLLGRKVLTFPFSSKFCTLKYQPGVYPVRKWRQVTQSFFLFKKLIYQYRYKNKYSCNIDDWQQALKDCQSYPDILQASRQRNQWYYSRVLDLLT